MAREKNLSQMEELLKSEGDYSLQTQNKLNLLQKLVKGEKEGLQKKNVNLVQTSKWSQ
jgi:hypothetical protein